MPTLITSIRYIIRMFHYIVHAVRERKETAYSSKKDLFIFCLLSTTPPVAHIHTGHVEWMSKGGEFWW